MPLGNRQFAEALLLKTLGYLVSVLSVLLLGVVSWQSAADNPLLFACLIGGMATSVLGMFLRWVSYVREKKEEAAQSRISK
ncbi:MAG: hypothetical protein JWQ52_42 [Phenylobacterium sp.]|nr:hypothetical protein [Phenylobacterium sp.]